MWALTWSCSFSMLTLPIITVYQTAACERGRLITFIFVSFICVHRVPWPYSLSINLSHPPSYWNPSFSQLAPLTFISYLCREPLLWNIRDPNSQVMPRRHFTSCKLCVRQDRLCFTDIFTIPLHSSVPSTERIFMEEEGNVPIFTAIRTLENPLTEPPWCPSA